MHHCTQRHSHFFLPISEPSDPNVVYLSGDQFRLSRNEDRFVFGYVTRVGVQPRRRVHIFSNLEHKQSREMGSAVASLLRFLKYIWFNQNVFDAKNISKLKQYEKYEH